MPAPIYRNEITRTIKFASSRAAEWPTRYASNFADVSLLSECAYRKRSRFYSHTIFYCVRDRSRRAPVWNSCGNKRIFTPCLMFFQPSRAILVTRVSDLHSVLMYLFPLTCAQIAISRAFHKGSKFPSTALLVLLPTWNVCFWEKSCLRRQNQENFACEPDFDFCGFFQETKTTRLKS